jgi:hypothetical protein
MVDAAPKTEVLRSLGRLVRGLSALFWGLPLSILVCVKTALSDWLRPMGMLPPIVVTSLLLYGLHQLTHFQKQERVWRQALDRAQLMAMVNVGMSPFIYWWNKLPMVPFYFFAVGVLLLSALLFLFNLNQVLRRLAAMLPDETLRMETALFTTMNLYLLCMIVGLVALYLILQQLTTLPMIVIQVLRMLEFSRQWLLIFLVLLPLAMTMTLIWKIKEVILASVFGAGDV